MHEKWFIILSPRIPAVRPPVLSAAGALASVVIDPSLSGLSRRVHRIERDNRALGNFPAKAKRSISRWQHARYAVSLLPDWPVFPCPAATALQKNQNWRIAHASSREPHLVQPPYASARRRRHGRHSRHRPGPGNRANRAEEAGIR